VDTVLPNGLRVIAVHSDTVPMVELRVRIPFAGNESPHEARAEVLAETLLTGTARRDRVAVDTDLALVGGELDAGVDPERLSVGGNALAGGLDTLLDVLADAPQGS
jgi:predicted Zn-dependent peptidase